MGKFRKKFVPGELKQKHPKNKRHKTQLVFDEKAREDWLTGFRKRKNERRKKAQDEIISALKEEKRRLQKKKRDETEERLKNFHVNDIEEIAKAARQTRMYDLPQHTVTVSDVSHIDFGSTGVMLGTNIGDDSDDDVKDEEADETNSSDSDVKNKCKEDKSDGKNKRKFNPKKHKNFSHAMHNTKVPKKIKASKEFRATMKRKQAKVRKRSNCKK